MNLKGSRRKFGRWCREQGPWRQCRERNTTRLKLILKYRAYATVNITRPSKTSTAENTSPDRPDSFSTCKMLGIFHLPFASSAPRPPRPIFKHTAAELECRHGFAYVALLRSSPRHVPQQTFFYRLVGNVQ